MAEVNYPKSERLAAMAHNRAKSKNLPYSVALSEIGRENPGLVEAARLEVMDLKVREFSPGHDPSEALARMARQRCTEKNLPYAVALSEICCEVPELARAAREFVLGCKV